ncbi:biotin synthesis protein bioc [Lasius niger]|uniref:Biotin synthesis protein bioc n=1 Tax=Lasius niger TaxID=67767 RepID=A0A0J7K2S2_LASNI|nr:biotin synthesis protein bioc [Lasius niger]
MIDYARRNFMNDERIDFDIFDIQTKNLPAGYIEEFDHIFSYPTLHSRNDIQQEFKNVFDMLKPEGCFHMAIVVMHDAFRLYNRMENHPVYGKYFKKYSSPFHYAINAEDDLKRLLRNVGFTVKYCRTKSDMKYETDYLLPFIFFGLPFMHEIPLEQAEDLKEKLTTRFNGMEKMINRQYPNNPDYEEYHTDLYEIIEIHACKSSNIPYV